MARMGIPSSWMPACDTDSQSHWTAGITSRCIREGNGDAWIASRLIAGRVDSHPLETDWIGGSIGVRMLHGHNQAVADVFCLSRRPGRLRSGTRYRDTGSASDASIRDLCRFKITPAHELVAPCFTARSLETRRQALAGDRDGSDLVHQPSADLCLERTCCTRPCGSSANLRGCPQPGMNA